MNTTAKALSILALVVLPGACARGANDDAAPTSPAPSAAIAANQTARQQHDDRQCSDEDEEDEFENERMREADERDLPPCPRPAKSRRTEGGQNDPGVQKRSGGGLQATQTATIAPPAGVSTDKARPSFAVAPSNGT